MKLFSLYIKPKVRNQYLHFSGQLNHPGILQPKESKNLSEMNCTHYTPKWLHTRILRGMLQRTNSSKE